MLPGTSWWWSACPGSARSAAPSSRCRSPRRRTGPGTRRSLAPATPGGRASNDARRKAAPLPTAAPPRPPSRRCGSRRCPWARRAPGPGQEPSAWSQGKSASFGGRCALGAPNPCRLHSPSPAAPRAGTWLCRVRLEGCQPGEAQSPPPVTARPASAPLPLPGPWYSTYSRRFPPRQLNAGGGRRGRAPPRRGKRFLNSSEVGYWTQRSLGSFVGWVQRGTFRGTSAGGSVLTVREGAAIPIIGEEPRPESRAPPGFWSRLNNRIISDQSQPCLPSQFSSSVNFQAVMELTE